MLFVTYRHFSKPSPLIAFPRFDATNDVLRPACPASSENVAPDAGSVQVLGQPASGQTQDLIGYLPEERESLSRWPSARRLPSE
jgi:hypothetical protein